MEATRLICQGQCNNPHWQKPSHSHSIQHKNDKLQNHEELNQLLKIKYNYMTSFKQLLLPPIQTRLRAKQKK